MSSANQRIGAGLWFSTVNGPDTLIGGFESTSIPQMPLVENFVPIILKKLYYSFQDHLSQ